MITAHLTGNMGNNLSQMAITRLIAYQKGYAFGFDKPTHDDCNGKNQLYFMNLDMGQPVQGIVNTFEERWDFFNGINITCFDRRVYDIANNTCLIGHNGAYGGLYQSEQYYRPYRDKLLQWFSINTDYSNVYESIMKEKNIILDDSTCVINFRGSHHYRGQPDVLLRKEYWRDAVRQMRANNNVRKFICITDDVELAREYMPEIIPVIHVDIGFDYYVVNKAQWLIISNSSFGYWAAWLNENVKMTIAPKFWAHHNVSNGYWALGDQYNSRFTYLDRNGVLTDYDTCRMEAVDFYKANSLLPQLYETI